MARTRIRPVMRGPDVTPGRIVAFDTVRAVEDGEFLDRAFTRIGGDLDDRERRWARECAYGVFRQRGRLDHLLSLRLRRALGDLDPPVLSLLRAGRTRCSTWTRCPTTRPCPSR